MNFSILLTVSWQGNFYINALKIMGSTIEITRMTAITPAIT